MHPLLADWALCYWILSAPLTFLGLVSDKFLVCDILVLLQNVSPGSSAELEEESHRQELMIPLCWLLWVLWVHGPSFPTQRLYVLTPTLSKNSEDQHPKARIIALELQLSKSLARFLSLGISFELSHGPGLAVVWAFVFASSLPLTFSNLSSFRFCPWWVPEALLLPSYCHSFGVLRFLWHSARWLLQWVAQETYRRMRSPRPASTTQWVWR